MGQTKQKILGNKGLILLIALLSAFVPLSTDLYLPALPGMSEQFGQGAEKLNLTLTLFFFFYAIGTLIWGPLSDRYGRKPILLIGLSLYVAASTCCALTQSVNGLILFRVLEALGASASGAVATAVVKDVFSGKTREKVLAIVQSMSTIAPAVAPVLGAYLLKVMSWRGVFWVLGIVGGLALIGSLLFQESVEERTSGPLFQSLGRLGKVLQNWKFTYLWVLFSIGVASSMAYVASSTYVYQDGFGLSSQAYSFYFAINALGMLIGPILYLRLTKYFKPEKMIGVCFIINAACGGLVLFFGNLQPWIFLLCILPSSIAGSLIRPPSTNFMLEQQTGDNGSVSSLIGSGALLMGSLGMQIISQPWGNRVIALGIIMLGIGLLDLIAWPLAYKRIILPSSETVLESGQP